MKQITINTYKFEELSKEAQAKAIKNMSESEDYLNYGWYDLVVEEYTQKLESLGYIDIKIMFNGFYSQGDGACFTANVDIRKWLEAHKMKTVYKLLYQEAYECGVSITHNYRYYFAKSTDVSCDYAYFDDDKKANKVNDQLDKVVELITKEREELGDEIYKALTDEYRYLNSDEAIRETLIANEYDFEKDGEMY